MSEQKRYIIVAGINGAGKSTLYRTRPELFAHSKRLNADEILQAMGGNWRKDRDNFKAMREEIKQLHAALDYGQSIHVETTLAGQGKAQLNLIDRAHKSGFEVTLLYVALKSEKRQLIVFMSGSKKVGMVYQMKSLKNVIVNQIII